MRRNSFPCLPLLLLLGTLLATPAGASQPFATYFEGFFPPGLLGTTGQEAWFGRAADLDGDGRDELITGRWDLGGGGASILTVRRFGSGLWSSSTVTSHVIGHSGWTPGLCEVADLDGNGTLDLAVPVYDTLVILPATAPGTFGAPVYVPMPGVGGVAVADFDHDGTRDLAVTRFASNDVQVWRGTGPFTYTLTGSFSTHYFPIEIAVVDLNGDPDPDIVAAADTTSLALLGDGLGNFTPLDVTGSRAQPCGDLDGDGNEDLLTESSALLGNGDGTFQPATPYLPVLLVAKAADLDEDGKLDLIGRRQMTPNHMLSVQKGLGNGQFGTPSYPAWWSGQPDEMAIGDFDGDGHLDVASPGRNTEPDAIYYGRGNGTFHTPRQVTLTSPPLHVASGSLGGDSRPDLVVTSRSANSMSILLSNGLGSWAPADTLILPATPAGRRIAVADLNADGRSDIVVGYSNAAMISVWLTQPSGLPGARTDLVVPATTTVDLQIADLDNDTVPDIMWAQQPTSFSGDPIRWFRGLGGGAFAAAQALTVNASQCFTVGDLSGDGIADIATTLGNTAVLVAIASAPGVFPSTTSYGSLSVQNRQIVIADLDGDPYPDLALHDQNGVLRLHGLGGGAFASPVVTGRESSGGTNVYCEARDLDGDGVDDLVSGLPSNSRLRVARFGTGGTLVGNPILAISLGSTTPANIALADVDGNGTFDILSGISRRPWLDLLLNRTSPEVLGVRPLVVGARGLALAPLADPARDVVAFRLGATLDASVRVDLLDVQGRRLRSTIVRPNPGAATIVSFGRVESIPAGLYFARARQGGVEASTRISVVR